MIYTKNSAEFPCLPFHDYELAGANIIKTQLGRKVLGWQDLKKRRGSIRCDLTSNLDKTPGGMPIVKAYHGDFPAGLVSLSEINSTPFRGVFVHCFSEDHVIERLWTNPESKFKAITNYAGMLSADFSMKLDMAPPENLYNCFRNHACAQLATNHNIATIYTLCWAGFDTFDYAFDGIETGGIYAVNTVGTNRDFVTRKFFKLGLRHAIKVLNPTGIIIYGDAIDFAVGCELRVYANKFIQRLRMINKVS